MQQGKEPREGVNRKGGAELTGRSPFAVRRLVFLGLLVAGLTVAVHWPALSARAVMFDDEQYLDDNPLVQTPSWRSAERFLTEVLHPSTVGGYYQPLAMISLMIDYGLGGRPDRLTPFHATSLALHGINTFLVVVVLFMLFRRPVVAAIVGLAFGLHPMNVESIPWLAERKTLLGAFFALLSLICYVKYARPRSDRADEHGPGDAGSTIGPYIGCTVFFVLALLSKPTTTPLPLCMILLDIWPLRRFGRRSIVEKLPLLLLAAASAVITVLSQRNTADITRPLDYPVGAIPLILCHNVVFYLRKLIWPWPLSGYYPFPPSFSLGQPAYLIGLLGTVALVAALVALRRRATSWIVGCLFFFIAIFPTLGIVGFTAVIAADRFVYLPMIGLLLPAAHLLGVWWSDCTAAWKRPAILMGSLIVVACYGFASHSYLGLWQNTETFMRHMLATAPQATSLHLGLGTALEKQGRMNEAADEFSLAVRYAPPGFHTPRVSLGHALLALGKIEQARAELDEALRIKPFAPEVHAYLADCLAQQGMYQDARSHYEKAIQLRPGDYKPYYNLATFLAGIGRSEEAVEQFKLALKIKPDNPSTLYNMGLTYFQMGRMEEAFARLSDALRVRPSMARVHYQLACANMVNGKIGVALDFWRSAIKVEPKYVEAMADLAWVLAVCEQDRYRNGAEALRWAKKADELTGSQEPLLLDALAAAQAESGRMSEAVATQQRAINRAQGAPPGALSIGARSITLDQLQARLRRYEAGQPFHESIRLKTYQPARPPKQ